MAHQERVQRCIDGQACNTLTSLAKITSVKQSVFHERIAYECAELLDDTLEITFVPERAKMSLPSK